MTIDEGQQKMLDGLFSAIDAMDTGGFVAFLTEDAVFRFGSAPAVSGSSAIGEAVGGFFSGIAGLSHKLTFAVAEGSTLVTEGEVTYTRHDGSRITLPFVDVFEMEGEKIAAYKIYMDIGPLYSGPS